MKTVKDFLRRKDIVFSRGRYLVDALSAMALGLFASLICGLIFKTAGQQIAAAIGANTFSNFLIEVGAAASAAMGSAIGVAVAWGLKSPPLVLFTSAVTGSMGAALGGPAGAFVAAALGAECGKAISKETRLDIVLTPALTMASGMLAAATVGPAVSALMQGLGAVVMRATEMRPLLMGVVVSVVMGLVLTAPISSAALAIMLGLSGLAGGAATAGCCAQMIGFAVISYDQNGLGGFFAQGIGTSMLQVGNIAKNPWILLPPTLAGAIVGPIATLWGGMLNTPEGSGMGTSGLVGQIGTITAMGASADVLLRILLLHFLLPAALAKLFDKLLRKAGKIKGEDYLLQTG